MSVRSWRFLAERRCFGLVGVSSPDDGCLMGGGEGVSVDLLLLNHVFVRQFLLAALGEGLMGVWEGVPTGVWEGVPTGVWEGVSVGGFWRRFLKIYLILDVSWATMLLLYHWVLKTDEKAWAVGC